MAFTASDARSSATARPARRDEAAPRHPVANPPHLLTPPREGAYDGTARPLPSAAARPDAGAGGRAMAFFTAAGPRSGPIRIGDAAGRIDVRARPHGPPIGSAARAGSTPSGIALWQLTVH